MNCKRTAKYSRALIELKAVGDTASLSPSRVARGRGVKPTGGGVLAWSYGNLTGGGIPVKITVHTLEVCTPIVIFAYFWRYFDMMHGYLI